MNSILGWCEQGGTLSSMTYGLVEVPMLIKMKDLNYNITVTRRSSTNTVLTNFMWAPLAISTEYFNIRYISGPEDDAPATGGSSCWWVVQGLYIK